MSVTLGFVHFWIGLISWFSLSDQGISDPYPSAVISNHHVVMKLYLPDPEKGFYRGARFDWSGMIKSLEYKGHQYFGEWSQTRDPLSHSDVSGPVDGYITPGLGYDEARIGGEFVRIGIGALEKPDEPNFLFTKSYKIINHGKWITKTGKNWIEFCHELKTESGWGYVYTKRIELTKDTPGFNIVYSLENTGNKSIETDQFNHNFFIIDKGITGPDFSIKLPFACNPVNDPKNKLDSLLFVEGNELVFRDKITSSYVWVNLAGFGKDGSDNGFEIINKKSGAGVRVQGSKPLYKFVLWAKDNTLCPENFIYLNVPPGKTEIWSSEYTLFTEDQANKQ